MASRYDTSEVTCVCGSGMTTRLRCSRCGKPICPDCMIETPVGYRCPECASGPRMATYRPTTNIVFAKALAVGMVVTLAVGIIWGLFPAWGFYLALLLGFGVVESMSWVANYKRGRDLMAAAMGLIAIGLLVSRYTIAVNSDVLTINLLINNIGNEFVRDAFYLRLIPDFLFMAIPFVIAYIRFR